MADDNVGSVYIDVLPDTSGFADALEEGTTVAAEGVGDAAGEIVGQGVLDGFAGTLATSDEIGNAVTQAVLDTDGAGAGGEVGTDVVGGVSGAIAGSTEIEGAILDNVTSIDAAGAGTTVGEDIASGAADAISGSNLISDSLQATILASAEAAGTEGAAALDSALAEAGSGLEQAMAQASQAASDAFNLNFTDGIEAATEAASLAFTSSFGQQVSDTLDNAMVGASAVFVANLSDDVTDALVEATDAASEATAGGDDAEQFASELTGKIATSVGELANNISTVVGPIFTDLIDKLKGSITGLIGIVAGGFLVRGALNAFEPVEKAISTLRFGLEKLGYGGAALLEPLVQWAEEFSAETGISEAAILGMTSKLTNLGNAFFKSVGPEAAQYIERTTEALTNMGTALGRPAAGLMRTLGPNILNSPEKAVAILQKWGALTAEQSDKVRELAAANDKLGATQEILNVLTERYGGVAAAALTPMEQLHNTFNLVSIEVGRMLNPALKLFADVISALPVPLQAMVLVIGGLGGLMFELAKYGTSVARMFSVLGEAFRSGVAGLKLLLANTGLYTITVVSQTAAVGLNTVALQAEAFALNKMSVAQRTAALATKGTTDAQIAQAGFGLKNVAALTAYTAAIVLVGIAFVKVKDLMQKDEEFGSQISKTIEDGTASLSEWNEQIAISNNTPRQDTGGWFSFITDAIPVVGELKDAWASFEDDFTDQASSDALGHAMEEYYNRMVAMPDVLSKSEKAQYQHALSTGDMATAAGILDDHLGELTVAEALYSESVVAAVAAQDKFDEGLVAIKDSVADGTITAGEASQQIAALALALGVELPKSATAMAQGIAGSFYSIFGLLSKSSDTLNQLASVTGSAFADLRTGAVEAFKGVEAAYENDKPSMASWLAFTRSTMDSARAAIASWQDSTATSLDFVAAKFSEIAGDVKLNSREMLAALREQYRAQVDFDANLATILERGGANADLLVQHLIDMGAGGARAAEMIANGSLKIQHGWETTVGKGKTQSHEFAASISDEMVGALQDVRDMLQKIFEDLQRSYLLSIGVNATVVETIIRDADNNTPSETGTHWTSDFDPEWEPDKTRASGGPVDAGKSYLVGERGPEVFTPAHMGQIISNHDLERKGPMTLRILDWRNGIAQLDSELGRLGGGV